MSKIKIVTDSTAYIDREFAELNNIAIVPLSVNFEGSVSNEGFPGEFDEFFQRLSVSKDFPTTSQPSVGVFAEVYKKAIDEGQEVVVLTISSKLSGTFNSASAAANLVDPDKISVIDTETIAANLRVLVELALKLSEEGAPRVVIVSTIEAQKKKMGIRLTVGTLEYLKKGGRLSNAGALIGSLLNIKPIIALKDGKLEPVDKVRGRKKALEKIVEDIQDDVTEINIAHIYALDEALELKAELSEKYPNAKIGIQVLGPVVGAHLGPKALGVLTKY